jgi:hypothetical protein
MLAFYISDLKARLSKRDEPGGWEVSTIDLIDMNRRDLRWYRRSRLRSIA